MPRTLQLDPGFTHLLAAQDQVVTRRQAQAAGLNNDAIAHRAAYSGWCELLPNVFLTHRGEPARRQRLVAALLWAGPDAAIDHRDACRFHGITGVAVDDDFVYVVVPANSGRRSTSFVRVRRSASPFRVVRTTHLR